jgi:hypothetical protein
MHAFRSKKNDILIEITGKGLLPIIEELDSVVCCNDLDNDYANKMEEYWIHQFKSWGYALTNIVGVKRNYKEAQKIKWENHDREFGALVNRADRLRWELRFVEQRVMPEQMNTPLGRKCWRFDIQKEKDIIGRELFALEKEISQKRKKYYNL